MKTLLTQQQIQSYQNEGFLLVEDFLDQEELAYWRQAVTEAMDERNGQKMPGSDIKVDEDESRGVCWSSVQATTSIKARRRNNSTWVMG